MCYNIYLNPMESNHRDGLKGQEIIVYPACDNIHSTTYKSKIIATKHI